MQEEFTIREASIDDSALIVSFIKELAAYEKLAHEVVADENLIRETLFGKNKFAEVIFGFQGVTPVSFALFFHNYSTFLARPGIYLEDLFVKPSFRGKGIGKKMLQHLANIAVERNCGRFEWWVLDWNEPAIGFYKKLGAKPMDEWTVFRVTGDDLLKLANGKDEMM